MTPKLDIHLRQPRKRDAAAVYAAIAESRAEISRFMEWCTPTYDRRDAAKWIEIAQASWKHQREFAFLVEDGEGRLLGACGLNRIEWLSATANLGYWIRSSATGRGVCTAAVAKLREFAFSETKLFRLEIVAAVENLASQHVAEKAGAVREGILRLRTFVAGERQDAVIYSILRSDQ